MRSPYQVAQDEHEAGVREVPGPRHNIRIVEYFSATNLEPMDGDETPWCSAFVNWCCRVGWTLGTNRANARSWLSWGEGVQEPRPGDVVVFWREAPTSWKGHVGFYVDGDGVEVLTLGGNQGNRVSVRGYAAAKVLGFRRATSVERLA